MKICENIEQCIFFNNRMSNMPTMAEIYKKQFCKGEFSECARYILLNEFTSEDVPGDLFPIQKERAEKIKAKLEKSKKS